MEKQIQLNGIFVESAKFLSAIVAIQVLVQSAVAKVISLECILYSSSTGPFLGKSFWNCKHPHLPPHQRPVPQDELQLNKTIHILGKRAQGDGRAAKAGGFG